MPEEPEIDTDKLHEEISEELEREGGYLLKWIALTTAICAAVAALAALEAGDTVNEALILKTEAARSKTEASDRWAFYQAEGLKAAIKEGALSAYDASGKPSPAVIEKKRKHYLDRQAEEKKTADAYELACTKQSDEANDLLYKHHKFADAVALLQVAIALGAVSALTRSRLVWLGSLGISAVGITFLVWAFLI